MLGLTSLLVNSLCELYKCSCAVLFLFSLEVSEGVFILSFYVSY